MEDWKVSYNEMLACDRARGDYRKTRKYQYFQKKQIVTLVLHSRWVTILKLYQILLTKTQGKDKPGRNTTRIEHEQKYERRSTCKYFRIRSITCKYWQCLHRFSKFNQLPEGCDI